MTTTDHRSAGVLMREASDKVDDRRLRVGSLPGYGELDSPSSRFDTHTICSPDQRTRRSRLRPPLAQRPNPRHHHHRLEHRPARRHLERRLALLVRMHATGRGRWQTDRYRCQLGEQY